MWVRAQATGTQSASIGTEHFVADVAVAGEFSFEVDLNAMVAGDVLEVRAYKMVLTSGTSRVFAYLPFYGVQPSWDLVRATRRIGNDLTDSTALRFSIKQTLGTGRSFPWKVLRYDAVGGIRKNVAHAGFPFFMYDSSGAPKTDLQAGLRTAGNAQRSIDKGAFADLANIATITEVGSGSYWVDLAAADLNGEEIALRFAASGAVDQNLTIKTTS